MVIFQLGIPDVILTAAALLHWKLNRPWDWDPLWSNDKMQLKQLTKTLPKLDLADELTNVHNPGAEKNTSKLCWGAYGAYAQVIEASLVKKKQEKTKVKASRLFSVPSRHHGPTTTSHLSTAYTYAKLEVYKYIYIIMTCIYIYILYWLIEIYTHAWQVSLKHGIDLFHIMIWLHRCLFNAIVCCTAILLKTLANLRPLSCVPSGDRNHKSRHRMMVMILDGNGNSGPVLI